MLRVDSPVCQGRAHGRLSSEVLSRLRSFLPEIADANALLVDSNVEDLDIENVDEDEQYIEMVRRLFLPSASSDSTSVLLIPTSMTVDDARTLA